MNNIVARSLLNKHFVVVRIGIFRLKVYQPLVKDLARIFDESVTINDGILSVSGSSLFTISKVLFRYRFLQYMFTWYMKRYSSFQELKTVSEQIERIMQGKDLFESVKIDKTKSKRTIETVGNNSIAGILTTLMDSIHVSYTEAFERINYPVMLLMSVDKLRTLTGDERKVIKTSGKELANRRKRK